MLGQLIENIQAVGVAVKYSGPSRFRLGDEATEQRE
jgi:hypothetical protein